MSRNNLRALALVSALVVTACVTSSTERRAQPHELYQLVSVNGGLPGPADYLGAPGSLITGGWLQIETDTHRHLALFNMANAATGADIGTAMDTGSYIRLGDGVQFFGTGLDVMPGELRGDTLVAERLETRFVYVRREPVPVPGTYRLLSHGAGWGRTSISWDSGSVTLAASGAARLVTHTTTRYDRSPAAVPDESKETQDWAGSWSARPGRLMMTWQQDSGPPALTRIDTSAFIAEMPTSRGTVLLRFRKAQ